MSGGQWGLSQAQGPTVCPPVPLAIFCDVFRAMKWGPEKWNQSSSYPVALQAMQRMGR